MARELEALGAKLILFPTIKIVPPPSDDAIFEAIAELDKFEWLLFTSANAVNCFFGYLSPELRKNLPKIAVVGPATGEALEVQGVHFNLMAESFQAEGLVESFSTLPHAACSDNSTESKPCRVLLPRALEARDVLEKQLPKLGYELTVAPVYMTMQAKPVPNALVDIEKADAIVFTSPSAVRHFLAILDSEEEGRGLDYLQRRRVFSIGPVTTAELHRLHLAFAQISQADQSTGKSLVELMAKSL